MDSGKIDLHLHTNFSDGSYSPAQLVEKIRQYNIATFSVTDHDNIDALPEILNLAAQYGLTAIPGIEFSTYVDEREVHILSYFFDPSSAEIGRLLKFCSDERVKRAERILKKLASCNIHISIEEVAAEAGRAPIGRPHIAMAMMKKGCVKNFFDAFEIYIGNNASCNEKKIFVDPKTIFDVVKNAGGISFLAHPSFLPDMVVKKIIDMGIDGLEVIHPAITAAQSRNYIGVANSYFLLTSGGSDFHGGLKNDENNFGQFCIPQPWYTAIINRLHDSRR